MEFDFRKICGETGTVTTDTTEHWVLTTMPSSLDEFRPDDIFNVDQTGLFWKCLPDKSLILKGKTYNGGKGAERITVLFVQI